MHATKMANEDIEWQKYMLLGFCLEMVPYTLGEIWSCPELRLLI
jgi:hypothetical protein